MEDNEIRDMVIRHDTKINQWFGNGQPGTMKGVMDDIEELKKIKWKLIGAGVVLVFIMELLHVGLEKGVGSLFH